MIVSASGSDGSSGTGTVNLTPSGFVIAGPNNASSVTTNGGSTTNLTITSARLDSSLNFAEAQPLSPGVSASVTLTESPSAVGSVTPTTIPFAANQTTAAAQFTAANTGNASVTALTPVGYSTPAGGANVVNFNVAAPGMNISNVTVGQNLQTNANITLNGTSPSGGISIDLESSDPTKVVFSSSSGTLGTGSLTLSVPAGFNHTPDFYVQAVGGTGTVSYTASAPGFGMVTGMIKVTPSGIIIAGPFGIGQSSYTTTVGPIGVQVSVYSAQFDPVTGNPTVQPVRAGLSPTVNISQSIVSVGTLANSSLTINGGSSTNSTYFSPISNGSTVLSVDVPTGYSAPPVDTSLTIVVKPQAVGVSSQVTVGMNLETAATISLGQPATAGGLGVTIASNDPRLLLAVNPTDAGQSTIFLTVPSGANSASFYVQGGASSGSATYTATASGYQPGTGTVNFGSSGVVLSGPYGANFSLPLNATAGGSPINLTLSPVLLDNSGNVVGFQTFAGGSSLPVTLSNSNPAAGTVPPQVTITGGSDTASFNFTPVATGSVTIMAVTPNGYTAVPGNYGTVRVNVQ